MKAGSRIFCCTLLLLGNAVLCLSFGNLQTAGTKPLRFPYQDAGLTDRQAAAHLLSRFTYGAKPGQIDAVAEQGLENWFQQQLEAQLPDDSLTNLLGNYDALNLSNAQVAEIYTQPGQVLKMAVKDGVVDQDSVKTDQGEYKRKLLSYMEQQGLKPQQELFRQFVSQKILRAAYSNNQLQEVMTSFWFNHFNVSLTKNSCSRYIPAYERDVIRPDALGRFGDLLLATAKSPAMLYYLDNFSSAAENEPKKAAEDKMRNKPQASMPYRNSLTDTISFRPVKAKKNRGLNENYAREVMELHTLGVDGGYSQQDVTEAARVLTGWTVYPLKENSRAGTIFSKATEEQLEKRGFVHEGDFLFTPNRHDQDEKIVMGKHFGPNGGYAEGVQLLEMLARHKSTAQFICRKLAIRFVSDNPPQSLIDKMANTFLEKDGDIKQILITMVTAPEFWNTTAVRHKIKSPFELAIGAVRNLDASISQPYQLYKEISKMGEKMYSYHDPTGFPDRGQYWINTGSLLNRMNFGLALAGNRIPGVNVDLAALGKYHEPESKQAALLTYSRLMMPERDLEETIKRLTPMINDPELPGKIGKASVQTSRQTVDEPDMNDQDENTGTGEQDGNRNNNRPEQTKGGDNDMLELVVGIIIGSPEYQRR